MGYAVLHLEKASGMDSGLSAHIERTITPKNADPLRTHLLALFTSLNSKGILTLSVTAKVESHSTERGKLRLMIDGVSDSTWFRNKHREFYR